MGLPMSSAATPAFHAMPQTLRLVPRRNGRSSGQVCAQKPRNPRTPKTRSISPTWGLTSARPSSAEKYTAGKTARKTAMPETEREPTHMSSSTMMHTMGTLLRAVTAGASASSTARQRRAARASSTADTKAARKPPTIRVSEKATVERKRASKTSCASLTTVSRGPASSTALPTTRLATCHTTSHRTAEATLRASLLSRPRLTC